MKILFVCMGNICRSPLAAAVARRDFQRVGLTPFVAIDSAGTLDFHAGHSADPRAIELGKEYGLDLSGHRARGVRREDFEVFDWIVAMDHRNVVDLRRLAPVPSWGRIRLLLSFAGRPHAEVPDPYYGGRDAFVQSFALIREGVAHLTKHLARLHNLDPKIPE